MKPKFEASAVTLAHRKRTARSSALAIAIAFLTLFAGMAPGFAVPVYAAAGMEETEDVSSIGEEQAIDDDVVSGEMEGGHW
jgi:hypothetical protein